MVSVGKRAVMSEMGYGVPNRALARKVLIFLNNTPVKWYSERQNTVESSTYGAELVVLRIATEFVI